MEAWYQQSLTPPAVIELNVRLGVIASEDHAQCLAELKDPVSGILIGQWSSPHTTVARSVDALNHVLQEATRALLDHLDPF